MCLCTNPRFQVMLRSATWKLSEHRPQALPAFLGLHEAPRKTAKGLELTLVFEVLNQLSFFIIYVCFLSFTIPLAEELQTKGL